MTGSGSKIQDFMMILLAMFDSSMVDGGAKFTSWQVSGEVSRVLKKLGITGVPRITSDIDDFLLKKVDEFIGEIKRRRADCEKFFCFPVKKTSNCAKQGFAVTFSWIDKARIVIHFWLIHVFYNTVLVGMRLIVGSESGTTPSPFKPTTKKMNKCSALKSTFSSSIPLVRWYLSMTTV